MANLGGPERKWLRMLPALVLLGTSLTACASGAGATKIPSGLGKLGTTSTTLSPEAQAVINGWSADLREGYKILDQPPGPARANIVAGESTSEIWPELTKYFTGPSLQAEYLFLLKVKMAMLNGPSTYDLGNPVVRNLTAASATVYSCISDPGTTTQDGSPAPPDLGGDTPQIKVLRGTWTLAAQQGSWLVSGGSQTSAGKC